MPKIKQVKKPIPKPKNGGLSQTQTRELLGLASRYGSDLNLWRDLLPKRLAKATPSLVRRLIGEERERCRQSFIAQNDLAKDDPAQPAIIVVDDPVLDPELNPGHPRPGRARREQEIKEQQAEALRKRLAELRERKTEEDRKAKPAAPKKTERSSGVCRCGCGGATGGRFVPGHDARLKGLLLKAHRSDSLTAKQKALVTELGWERFILK